MQINITFDLSLLSQLNKTYCFIVVDIAIKRHFQATGTYDWGKLEGNENHG